MSASSPTHLVVLLMAAMLLSVSLAARNDARLALLASGLAGSAWAALAALHSSMAG